MRHIDFNSSGVVVEVLYLDGGEYPFICAVDGRICISALIEIEKSVIEQEDFSDGAGLYLCEANYYSGQYGEFGMCEIAPGWEITRLGYNPDWMLPVEDDRGDSQ